MSKLETMSPQELRDIRERLGLSTAAMAEKLNITQRAYQRLESGDRVIRGATVPLVRHFVEKLDNR